MERIAAAMLSRIYLEVTGWCLESNKIIFIKVGLLFSRIFFRFFLERFDQFQHWKMTLKFRILRCSRRLFIIFVSLTMTWFSEKMLIPTAYMISCLTWSKNLGRYLNYLSYYHEDLWEISANLIHLNLDKRSKEFLPWMPCLDLLGDRVKVGLTQNKTQ